MAVDIDRLIDCEELSYKSILTLSPYLREARGFNQDHLDLVGSIECILLHTKTNYEIKSEQEYELDEKFQKDIKNVLISVLIYYESLIKYQEAYESVDWLMRAVKYLTYIQDIHEFILSNGVYAVDDSDLGPLNNNVKWLEKISIVSRSLSEQNVIQEIVERKGQLTKLSSNVIFEMISKFN